MAWINYNNEYVNLDNVIAAEEINDKCIKLNVIGYAGAGAGGYAFQHREITRERMFARPPFGCTKRQDKSSCELNKSKGCDMCEFNCIEET